MSKKEITIREFADELIERLNNGQTVDCCKEELINLANMAKEKIGDEMILVEWKE